MTQNFKTTSIRLTSPKNDGIAFGFKHLPLLEGFKGNFGILSLFGPFSLRKRLAILLVRDNVALLCARTPTFPAPEVDGDEDF